MAPTQPSEAGGGESPAAGRPGGFDHEQYQHDLPGSEAPFVGPILDLVGVVLDATQRQRLSAGVAMRPAGPIPHTNAAALDHPELKRRIDTSEAGQVHELGQMWNDLGNEIMNFGASLRRTANSSEAIWVGQAGDAARATLTGLATWSQQTGQGVQYMGTTMRSQAEAAQTATRSMPDPVPYDPAMYQNQLNSTINPIAWIQILGDAREQYERHNAAHEEAIRVTETYSAALHDTNGTMPAFTPPQEFGNGTGGLTPGGTGSGAGGGAGIPPISPGAGGRTTGGADAPASGPPAPTPGQLVPPVPIAPTSPGPAGDGGRPGSGTPGASGLLPAPAAGIGRLGAGGRGPGVGSRPAGGRGSPGGGRGGAGGGGFGPRGSGGVSALDPGGRSASGSPGAAESAAGAGRGTSGVAGRGLGAGAGGAFPPMVGTGRGQGGDDAERQRPSYLVETEDIWGDGRRVAPPVIGEDPPEYYR